MMDALIISEINFDDLKIPVFYDSKNNKNKLAIRKICEIIGLSQGQMQNELRRVRKDIFIKNGITKDIIKTNGGYQLTTLLDVEYLSIWLSKINTKALNDNQYKKLIKLLNWSLSEDFNTYKVPTKIYEWEGELRDEIYECGFFGKYEIIDKEVVFSFGRIDLLAKDKNDELVVIELKKHKNYNDVIEQCKKYINGYKEEFNKDVKVVICTLDDDSEFLTKARESNIEVYTYKRELKLKQLI